MDKFLESRWFLRGFALMIALFMFFSANNVEEGSNSSTSSQNDIETIENVPVDTMYNEEEFVVSGVPSTIDVTVEGPAAFVARTNSARDFRVFINMSDLDIGTHEVNIQYENFSPELRVTLNPSVATVTIDERLTQEFRVDAEFNQSIVPEGFQLDSIDVEPETVQITGARSVLESIRYVRASLSTDGEVEDGDTFESAVQVLDGNLDKLPVSIEPQNVDLTVNMSQPSKEVTLVPVQQGEPGDGLEIEDISLVNETVTIFGPTRTIDEIDQIEVPFDISGVTRSGSRIEVPIPVPEGVSELSSETASAVVTLTGGEGSTDNTGETADTEDPPPDTDQDETASNDNQNENNNNTTEELTLSALPVETRNIGDDLQATFLQPAGGELNLRVTGDAETLEGLSEDDFSLYIDAEGLDEGEHNVEVQVEGPSNVTYILSRPSVTISLAQA
ncbi:YbbR-like domain-containing protein [Jeotgalibacillus sp. R-1-5s-1]|uniref:CdaR family protein n=1 Tax=Jeotgalibacillus sp. R-1-5s-1 TaxID=2555897 RepID=UPI00141B2A53|nr:CdaR family protein [Jeotgalibacillus sp. R-1-5s-1]